ncbi:MAG: alpha/beta hydrolase [Cyanobacteria bacterium J06638_28]
MSFPKPFKQLLQTTAIAILSGLAAAVPARSADAIFFDYGLFGRSLPVSSLETFIENGTVDADLAPYLELIPADKQQQFRQDLSTPVTALGADIPVDVSNPFVLSQLLYTPIGELVLDRVGELIQTEGRQNGRQAIRSAIILAAADPEGLSLINLIRFYPTGGIRLDLQKILALSKAVNANIETTNQLVEVATQQSIAAAAMEPALDYNALPNPAELGPFEIEMRSLMLQDEQRDRNLPIDLYLPRNLGTVPGPISVIILSHGYGDTRQNPEASAAARKLAANGFVVAMPEHIGSNKAYQDDLTRGLVQESFEAMEFINRPLDIRFLLDTLEQKNATEFQGRLQLDRVGLVGHSFGGYTALASAGATVDIDYLQQQCTPRETIDPDQVNIALLLECRALELMASPDVMRQLTDGSMTDERVGLVMTLAPVSNLFGESGVSKIDIPVVIMGGASDIASPLALEQLTAFRGLTTAEKYLYLGENLSHTPALTRVALNATNPNSAIADNLEETEELFSNLVVSLAIAHNRVYLQGDESYRPYLTSAYVEAVSVEPFKLHLLRSVPEGF